MLIKTISRSTQDYTRERKNDIHPVFRSAKPTLHPFQEAREYNRALNAAKVERIFAKPFVAALSGHADGVYALAKRSSDLHTVVTGAGDGEIRAWELTDRRCVWSSKGAHHGLVTGVCLFPGRSGKCVSVGVDQTCKIWDMSSMYAALDVLKPTVKPLNIYTSNHALQAVDNHRQTPHFVVCGASGDVDLYDAQRSEPIKTFSWGADAVSTVRFNPIETDIFASCGSDRSTILYDLRSKTPLVKLVTVMKMNALAWNPMEAYILTGANEDHNLYTFDTRKMNHAINIFKDHVSAVMCVDYSPTGQEICSGSYDKTMRIFRCTEGKSRDVYHTRRMQRLFSVQWTQDANFVLTGSDDGNVRLWKAQASVPLGPKSFRERAQLEYKEKLKEKFAHLPEVNKVLRSRNIPRVIKKTQRTKKIMLDSRKRKQQNERKHAKFTTAPVRAERQKIVHHTED